MAVTQRKRLVNGKTVTKYQAEVRIGSERICSKVFSTKAAAYVWHEQEKERAKKEILKSSMPRLIMTVGNLVDTFFSSTDFSELRAKTKENHRFHLRYVKESRLGEIPIEELTDQHVDAWIKDLIASPYAESKTRRSFQMELRFFATLLNWYRNNYDSKYVPPIVKRHRKMVFYKALPPKRRDHFLSQDDIQNWLAGLSRHQNPVYFDLATFLLLTGCRVGEAAALRWENVDLASGLAAIVATQHWPRGTKEKDKEGEHLKTDASNRLVHLPEQMLAILTERKASAYSPLVFPGQGGAPLRYHTISTAFNHCFEKAGIKFRGTHIARHTFATWAYEASGGDLRPVQLSLGHTSITMSERYAKATLGNKRNTFEKAANLILQKGVTLDEKVT